MQSSKLFLKYFLKFFSYHPILNRNARELVGRLMRRLNRVGVEPAAQSTTKICVIATEAINWETAGGTTRGTGMLNTAEAEAYFYMLRQMWGEPVGINSSSTIQKQTPGIVI